MLKGIADSPLSGQAVLKGGTAIRKLCFPDYQFSETHIPGLCFKGTPKE